jgi:hypothetical protein
MERTCVSCAPINNSVRQFVACEEKGRQRVLKALGEDLQNPYSRIRIPPSPPEQGVGNISDEGSPQRRIHLCRFFDSSKGY